MRRRRRKKEERTKFYLAIFVIVIMVSSTIGFVLDFSMSPDKGKDPTAIQFNDYEFTQTEEGLLTTKINDVDAYFGYLPTSVQYITVPEEVLTQLENAVTIRVIYDPDSEIADALGFIQYSFELMIPPIKGTIVLRGLASENKQAELPVYTCDNATFDKPVLYLVQGDDIRIDQEEGCIKLIGTDAPSMMQLHDRLLYALFGVMRDEGRK